MDRSLVTFGGGEKSPMSASPSAPCADPLGSAIVITDARSDPPGPTILYVNAAFEVLTGYSAAELVGRQPSMLQGPSTSLAAKKAMRKAIRHGQAYKAVMTNYRKNGEPYLCHIEIHPIRSVQGEPCCFIAYEKEQTKKRGRKPRL